MQYGDEILLTYDNARLTLDMLPQYDDEMVMYQAKSNFSREFQIRMDGWQASQVKSLPAPLVAPNKRHFSLFSGNLDTKLSFWGGEPGVHIGSWGQLSEATTLSMTWVFPFALV